MTNVDKPNAEESANIPTEIDTKEVRDSAFRLAAGVDMWSRDSINMKEYINLLDDRVLAAINIMTDVGIEMTQLHSFGFAVGDLSFDNLVQSRPPSGRIKIKSLSGADWIYRDGLSGMSPAADVLALMTTIFVDVLGIVSSDVIDELLGEEIEMEADSQGSYQNALTLRLAQRLDGDDNLTNMALQVRDAWASSGYPDPDLITYIIEGVFNEDPSKRLTMGEIMLSDFMINNVSDQEIADEINSVDIFSVDRLFSVANDRIINLVGRFASGLLAQRISHTATGISNTMKFSGRDISGDEYKACVYLSTVINSVAMSDTTAPMYDDDVIEDTKDILDRTLGDILLYNGYPDYIDDIAGTAE